MKPFILHIVTDITEMFSFLLFTEFFMSKYIYCKIYILISIFMHIVFIVDISDISSKAPIFKDALSLLIPIMDQWYIVGCVLGINTNKLNSLQQSNEAVKMKLSKVMTYRLSKKANEAVESNIVDNRQVSEDIRQFPK